MGTRPDSRSKSRAKRRPRLRAPWEPPLDLRDAATGKVVHDSADPGDKRLPPMALDDLFVW